MKPRRWGSYAVSVKQLPYQTVRAGHSCAGTGRLGRKGGRSPKRQRHRSTSPFCTQLTTSTHLGTHLSHTPPFNPPTTSQAKGISDQQSSVGANPFARSFTIQLFVYCMLLFIIINQTSSFTTLTFVPSDFVTTHSFWFPQHLPISRRFCAGFPTLSLTFYFLPS